MASRGASRGASEEGDETTAAGSDMTPAYVRVLVIELVVLVALFWIGRHFA